MTGGPSKKQCTRCLPNGIDYVSNLPDDVLSLVLSRLPTKDAVKTCVLSKYWEFKWTLVYNVKIDTEGLSPIWRTEPSFGNIVERVVAHAQNVKEFYLSCSGPMENELSRITTLISAMLQRSIEALELVVHQNPDLFLPFSLSDCTSLINLRLKFGSSCCSIKVPSYNSFLNLKNLSLAGLKILNETSNTDILIFNFPLLKVLLLQDCKWVKVKFLEIYAPSLRSFSYRTPLTYDEKDFDYVIKLFGAILDEFRIYGGYPENIIMIDSTVADAYLGYTFVRGNQLCGFQSRKLMREISSLMHLSIRDKNGAIWKAKRALSLPRFPHLNRLCLKTPFDAEGLLEFLNAAPLLRYLSISAAERVDFYDYDSVEPLPSCVIHHLEKVELNYDRCLARKFRFEEFLLKNGAQLKRVFIKDIGFKLHYKKLPVNEIVAQLSAFPKASAFAKIVAPRSSSHDFWVDM